MRVRRWSKLPFLDSKAFLVGLGEVSEKVGTYGAPYSIAALRTNDLRRHREARQCALFCYGMSQLLRAEVRFAPAEESDIDFVGWYHIGDTDHLVPIQVKELVPRQVKQTVSFQEEINKLAKYTDSRDLVVVFHVNRDVRVTPAELDFSGLELAELWIVGYLGDEAQEWLLCGNLLAQDISEIRFRYPEP